MFTLHKDVMGGIIFLILAWANRLGVYLFTLSNLTGWNILVGALGPIYIILLLIFVSGFPMLEKKVYKKWGDRPKYLEYKGRVGVLMPKILSH